MTKYNDNINVDKCVTIHSKQRYAHLEIDLWNNPSVAFNLSSFGAETIHGFLRGLIHGSKSKKASFTSGGDTTNSCMFVHNIYKNEAEFAAEVCKEILRQKRSTTIVT